MTLDEIRAFRTAWRAWSGRWWLSVSHVERGVAEERKGNDRTEEILRRAAEVEIMGEKLKGTCKICGREFEYEHKGGSHQLYCGRPKCAKERHRRAQVRSRERQKRREEQAQRSYEGTTAVLPLAPIDARMDDKTADAWTEIVEQLFEQGALDAQRYANAMCEITRRRTGFDLESLR